MTAATLTVSLSIQRVREYLMRSLDEKIRDFACSISYILINQQWLRNTIAPKGTNMITVVEENKKG